MDKGGFVRIFSIFFILVIVGCGGRVANPVMLERAFDDELSCSHYAGEYENNIKRLSELTGESKDKVRDNIGMWLVSPLLLDISNTQKEEAAAIFARNDRLQILMAGKNCPHTGAHKKSRESTTSEPAAPAAA